MVSVTPMSHNLLPHEGNSLFFHAYRNKSVLNVIPNIRYNLTFRYFHAVF